jgi:hypothetical protein
MRKKLPKKRKRSEKENQLTVSAEPPKPKLPSIWESIQQWFCNWRYVPTVSGGVAFEDFVAVTEILINAEIPEAEQEPLVRAILYAQIHGSDDWSDEDLDNFADIIKYLKGGPIVLQMYDEAPHDSRARVMLKYLSYHV